ncbi:MAG: HupE/UreJ family protein, partial [Polyangiaceae bacterium]
LFALTFGLLHGLGFAGGLTEAGLPAHDVPLALLGFNLGVELAQLAVVLTAWLLVALARRLPPLTRAPARLRLAPSYLIGSLAVMWCFERAAAWLG